MPALLFSLLLLLSYPSFAQDTQGIDTDLACETCHVGGDWQQDAGRGFDHLSTNFELNGTHADLECSNCHTGSSLSELHSFGNLAGECNSCHEDVHQDQWGDDCQRCHNEESWELSTQQQNHDLTRFPLVGPHRKLECESCHISNPGNTTNLPVTCLGCHVSDYKDSRDPSHVILDLDTDCERCHAAQTSTWDDSHFNHNETGYYLLGMHAAADCASCHTEAAQSTPSDCQSCHMADYNQSTSPAHLTEGYPQDCQECHTSFNWNSQFSHEQTGFILNGAHIETSCNLCHVNQVFDDTPEACGSCHTAEWEDSENPPHNDAEFDKSCENCHTEIDWLPASWTHDTETEYPLTGAHIPVTCLDCHQSAPYSEQASDCYACHQSNYEATSEPNHVSAGMSTTCEICHTTNDWVSVGVDHDQSAFPLVGAHAELDCEVCHSAGYDLPITCDGCHLDDFEGTVSGTGPDHQQFKFSIDCLECHSQVAWAPSHFDHDPGITEYEIQGAHLELLPNDCFACHASAQWTDIPNACEGCHQSNFTEATEPNHVERGFPDNYCEACHSQTAWKPAELDHTLFTVTCISCHSANYLATTDPDHQLTSYPEECESCHSTNVWTPAIVDHTRLTGTCVSCHLTDFQSATNPDHQSASFPEDCETCHTTDAWTPSTFDHASYFPIYSGQHMGEWNDCSQCHINAADFTAFTCFGAECHTMSDMNDEHFDGGTYETCNGITYTPNTVTPEDCYFCHPTGDGDDCEGTGDSFDPIFIPEKYKLPNPPPFSVPSKRKDQLNDKN
jgi:cytochrome c1